MYAEAVVIDAFRKAIEDAGYTPPPAHKVIADGKLHRFSINGKKYNDAGWYLLFNDAKPAGKFGSWTDEVSIGWSFDTGETATPEEIAEMQAKAEAKRIEREAEEARIHARAAREALAIWNAAKPVENSHGYLTKKGVKAYGVRLYLGDKVVRGMPLDGCVIVPAWDRGELHSLQFIAPDNRDGDDNKRFLPGGDWHNHYHRIGDPMTAAALCVCEGYATGASIHEATGYAVAVAFNAANLIPVAKALRARFPDAKIIIAADDDAFCSRGNAGLTKATEAAKEVDGILKVPVFPSPRHEGQTDFNDLHKSCGLEAVRSILMEEAPLW